MSKKLICFILIALTALSGCSGKNSASGKDENAGARLESIAELQKCLFVADIESVRVENALITKYNFGLTRYTVYTARITRAIDGYTPLGSVKLYWPGTAAEFDPRIDMKSGESYIIDAQPWIYGDELIYLLPIFTEAFPRVDTAGMVTLESTGNGILSSGTLDEYITLYEDAKAALQERSPGFLSAEQTLARFGDMLTEMRDKNCDRSVYTDAARGYEWTPDDAFIDRTAEKSEQLYDRFKRIDAATEQQAYDALRELLS